MEWEAYRKSAVCGVWRSGAFCGAIVRGWSVIRMYCYRPLFGVLCVLVGILSCLSVEAFGSYVCCYCLSYRVVGECVCPSVLIGVFLYIVV